MIKKYVPIIFDIEEIDKAIEVLQNNFDKITEEWNNEGNRKYLVFKNLDFKNENLYTFR